MSEAIDWSELSLAVLCGGRGERMGRSKADLTVRGVPILQFLLDQLQWAGPTLLITAPGRERPAGGDQFDAEYCDSPTSGSSAAGPLRGLATALAHAPTPQLVVATVDMPAVRLPTLRWIAARLHERPGWHGAMCSRLLRAETQLEPFPFACRTTALVPVQARLAGERHSVVGLARLPGFAVAPAPADFPPDTWTNLNSPDDYAAFVASLGPSAL